MLGVLDRAIARLVPGDEAVRLANLLDDAIDRMAGPRPTHPSAGNLADRSTAAPSGPAAEPAPAPPAAPWGHVVPAGAEPVDPWAPAASTPVTPPPSPEAPADPVAKALAHAFRRKGGSGSVTAPSSGYHPASSFTLVPGTGIPSEPASEPSAGPSSAASPETELPSAPPAPPGEGAPAAPVSPAGGARAETPALAAARDQAPVAAAARAAATPLSRPVWQANAIALTIGIAVLIILIWLVNAI